MEILDEFSITSFFVSLAFVEVDYRVNILQYSFCGMLHDIIALLSLHKDDTNLLCIAPTLSHKNLATKFCVYKIIIYVHKITGKLTSFVVILMSNNISLLL